MLYVRLDHQMVAVNQCIYGLLLFCFNESMHFMESAWLFWLLPTVLMQSTQLSADLAASTVKLRLALRVSRTAWRSYAYSSDLIAPQLMQEIFLLWLVIFMALLVQIYWLFAARPHGEPFAAALCR
jgi:hypothetical protein